MTGSNRRALLRRLVPVLSVVVLTGCGAGSTGSADGSDTGATTASSATRTTSPSPAVTSVSYRRSGGLKPVTVTRVFASGQAPPHGFTTSSVDRVLRAAQAFVDSDARLTPVPANTCCDRSLYGVVITWSDGTTKAFTTIDGLAQPKVFDVLLKRLA